MSDVMHDGLRRRWRAVIVIVLLAPLLPAVPGMLPDPDGAHDPAAVPAVHQRADEDRAFVASRPIVGFAINAHHIGDLDLYLESVDRIADLGANALLLVTPQFQRRVDSSSIRRIPSRCPTREQLVAILRRGKQRGLRTALLPIVLIEKPGEGDWRGKIDPRDWERWWESYDRFVDYYVEIAVAAEVDLLSVGSELNTTESQTERWHRIVSRVRSRYHGQITYSANWDRYAMVEHWPLVDVMSVSSYFELERSRPGAPLAAITRAWERERDRLLEHARGHELPLLLSEVGYPSLPWANAHPWNYVDKGETADHELQARCWRAFFDAWSGAFTDPAGPAVGFFGYRWDPYHHGQDTDTGYGILGKPAHDVVRDGIAAIRAAGDRAN